MRIRNRDKKKKNRRALRHQRVRARIVGTTDRPRVAVFRSNNHIFAQFVDDRQGRTIFGAGDAVLLKQAKGKTKTERAKILGVELARQAAEKGITKAVFDRGGFAYHGRIKAVAEGLREGGIKL